MSFDPDAYLATPPAKGGFDPDEFLKQPSSKSVSGFAKNAWEDVKGTASGLGHLTEGMVEHPIDTSVGVLKALPRGVYEEGKRIGAGELLTGHPINAMNKFVDAAYNKPLTTTLDVLPALGAAGKAIGIGGKAIQGADLAANAERLAPLAEDVAKTAPGALDDLVKMEPGMAGKGATIEAAEDFAKNPPKTPPPTGAAPETPPVPTDPLKEVRDYVTSKYGQASARPGFVENLAKYLQEESRNLGAKDLGLQPRQIQSMGPGFKGVEKAEALVDYAREHGYFDPKLTDIARKEKIIAETTKAGRQVDAVRTIADKRGAPPIPDMLQQVKTELTKQYGVDAPREIRKVLLKIENAGKENPTFSGMADLATELNKAKTAAAKLGQHPGPTTDAANIISRINNDAIRKVLNPEEQALYTDSLRNYGAHKKLEQAVAAASRRGMSARSNQRGILGRLWQEALDRGGYRMGGNIADRTAKAILRDPSKVKTLPQFFEELAHHADDVLDETLDINQGMAHGGIAGMDDLNDFLAAKYEKPKEKQ